MARGGLEARTVSALITGEGPKNLVEITVDTDGDSGSATGTVTTTDRHPFWVDDEGRWIDGGDLRPGQWLRDEAGRRVQSFSVRAWTQLQRVHNLTVAGAHTYYVMAGAVPVLVHKASCSTNAKKLGGNTEAAGTSRPAGAAAHHIVASGGKRNGKAAPAQQQLSNFGIDINDAANGVFLPNFKRSPNPTGASVRMRIHTNEYYSYVNNLMGGARNASEAWDVLQHVRGQTAAR